MVILDSFHFQIITIWKPFGLASGGGEVEWKKPILWTDVLID